MKYFNKLSIKLASLGVLMAAAALFSFGGTANADTSCLYQYVDSGSFTTSSTPVFNSICGIPTTGDETNFVRIRQSSTNTTTPTATQDEATSPTYSTTDINSSCSPGDEFDVWNYLHNNALSQDNDNGSGSAVAQGVTGDLQAPIGSSGTTFNFGYTVSANNAATVNDSVNLNCSNDVTLSLVPGSIHVLISPTGDWQDLIPESASSLNTPLALGNPVWGSGTEWGCWNYRILIIYEVQVTPVPVTQSPVCSSIVNDQADVEKVNYTGSNVSSVLLSLYNGTNTSGKPAATSTQLPYTFTNLAAGQQYTIVASLQPGNITSPGCEVSFTTPTTPPNTPPPATTTSTPPTTTTSLLNTGPGTAGTVGIFAGATVLGTALYNRVVKRRLAKR